MRTSTWRTAVPLFARVRVVRQAPPPWRAWALLVIAVVVRAPGPFLGQALDQYAAFMRLS